MGFEKPIQLNVWVSLNISGHRGKMLGAAIENKVFWWHVWSLKTEFDVAERHSVATNKHIFYDQIIRFIGIQTAKEDPILLKRIDFYNLNPEIV